MLVITGGTFRGRKLAFPKNSERVRPTSSKVRQALFNSLQTVISEAKVLDLFAGSGALGFEALSRGASWVTWVEDYPEAIRVIQSNAKLLGVERTSEVLRLRLCLDRPLTPELLSKGPFDLIFADPPYQLFEEGGETALFHWPWSDLLNKNGLFCLESSSRSALALPDKVGILVKIREKNYGDTRLTHYERQD